MCVCVCGVCAISNRRRLTLNENSQMVGLPATGKTHIAKRICRFLSFFHDIPSQIFNVGDYRRQLFGDFLPADFYDPDNEEGLAARHTACDAALADLIAYMRQDGVRVAAFDATNSTRERREHVIKMLTESGLGVKRMFLESICNDDGVSWWRPSICTCLRGTRSRC